MRLFSRKKSAPRWVDTPGFAWTPDEPLASGKRPLRPKPMAPMEPETVLPAPEPAIEIIPPPVAPEPRRAEPLLKIVTPEPQEEPLAPEPIIETPAETAAPIVEPPPYVLHKTGPWGPRRAPAPEPETPIPPWVTLASEIPPPPAPRKLPRPANSNQPDNDPPSSGLAWARLRLGLAQGFGFYVLLLTRSAGSFPGNQPGLFAALSLAGLLAPLLWLEGSGVIRRRLLLAWTGLAATGLFSAGLYQAWRGIDQAPEIPLLLLSGLVLFIAQAMLHVYDSRHSYRAAFVALWKLAARLLIWAAVTGIAWALLGSSASLVNWLRHDYPMLPPGLDLSFIALPLVGLASALGWHLTAGRARLGRWVQKTLIACATIALPLLVLLSAALVARHFAVAPVTLAEALVVASLLLVGINASYRWGWRRNIVRRWTEFSACFLMLALTAMAAVALDARVAEYGWSVGRIYACAATIALSCYTITYGGAALIAIGGGRWLQRIEPANIALAFAALAIAIALLTPLADPARLAAAAQAQRLEQGRADPAAFDFPWLRSNGRYGHDALQSLTHSRNPEVARDAAIALLTPANPVGPTPTEIGANITVRTPGARLPNSLLARDWLQVAKAPPCLTKPALACDAWFLDLDGDGRDEILLVYGNDARWWAAVMKQGAAGWDVGATLASPPCRGSLSALRAGVFAPAQPLPGWRDLFVGGVRLSPQPAQTSEPGCPK